MKPNIVAATLRSTTTASTLARQVQAEQNASEIMFVKVC